MSPVYENVVEVSRGASKVAEIEKLSVFKVSESPEVPPVKAFFYRLKS